jgi:hypothetical protein
LHDCSPQPRRTAAPPFTQRRPDCPEVSVPPQFHPVEPRPWRAGDPEGARTR